MQIRACVQNGIGGDVQGFLYIDDGTGETLVTTSPVYDAGSSQAAAFVITGIKGNVDATANVDVTGRSVDFTVNFASSGGTTTSMFSAALAVSSSPCL